MGSEICSEILLKMDTEHAIREDPGEIKAPGGCVALSGIREPRALQQHCR